VKKASPRSSSTSAPRVSSSNRGVLATSTRSPDFRLAPRHRPAGRDRRAHRTRLGVPGARGDPRHLSVGGEHPLSGAGTKSPTTVDEGTRRDLNPHAVRRRNLNPVARIEACRNVTKASVRGSVRYRSRRLGAPGDDSGTMGRELLAILPAICATPPSQPWNGMSSFERARPLLELRLPASCPPLHDRARPKSR
jgi:hypothetical protein